MSVTSPTVRIHMNGARGPSFADLLRSTGANGTLPTDSDAQAIAKLTEDIEASTLATSNLYSDTVSGIAGTSDGDYFSVPDTNQDLLILYKNDDGAAVEVNRYPSSQALERAASRGVHTAFAPDVSTNSLVVQDGTVDGFHRHFGGIAEGLGGRLHLVYRKAPQHANTSGATIWYTTSDDGGRTWSAERELIAGVAGYDQGGMSICATPTGRLVVIYDQVPSPLAAGVNMLRVYSDDNGATWSAPLLLTTIAYSFARAYGRIKVVPGPTGKHRLAWTPYWQTATGPNAYSIPLWLSEDDGLTFMAADPIHLGAAGYNEAEVVAITASTWFVAARGSGLNLFVSTNAEAGPWTEIGKIPTSDGVAPTLDKFERNGRWYLLLGYCDRSLDWQAFKIAPADAALTDAEAFGPPLVVSTDAVNASGYQSVVTKADGSAYVDGGTGFVWFKEYLGEDYSQVRFARADLFALSRSSGRGRAIASNSFTVYATEFEPKLIVTTEGGAPTGNLDTINGGYEGQIIWCESATSSLDVTFRHGVGNIVLANGRNFTLFTAGVAASRLALIRIGSRWYEITRSVDSNNAFYTEGAITPGIRGAGTAGSPTGTFAGTYTKIGRRVDFSARIVLTDLGGMAGDIEITGLPVAVALGAEHRAAISIGYRHNFTNDFAMGGYALEGSTTIRLMRMDQDNVPVTAADLSSTSSLYISGSYLAAV